MSYSVNRDKKMAVTFHRGSALSREHGSDPCIRHPRTNMLIRLRRVKMVASASCKITTQPVCPSRIKRATTCLMYPRHPTGPHR